MPLQSTSGAASYDAFGGGAAAVPNYIEDVFSTYLYTGNGSTQTITNGIDLAGKGGLVWAKTRDFSSNHALFDTVRGGSSLLQSNLTNAVYTGSTYISPFSSNGFTWAFGDNQINGSGRNYVSWTFRKQPKFFDVVTYTGNGTAGRTVAHNLGSVPGCMIIKRTDQVTNWEVFHRSLGATKFIWLNSTSGEQTSAARWNDTAPTSTQFTVGNSDNVNASGGTYVAYLFAHDAGGFGLTGLDNVISCGTFTTDGSGVASVSLGYEPQWVMTKNSSGSSAWRMFDTMRGMTVAGQNDALLQAQSSSEEFINSDYCSPNATGFAIDGHDGSATHIYIAIRRGPMEVPTSGTSVFSPVARTGNSPTVTSITSPGFAADLVWQKRRSPDTASSNLFDRLRGRVFLASDTTAAETAANTTATRDLVSFDNLGFTVGEQWSSEINASTKPEVYWTFGRAPGFFDEVCYTGTGVATTQAHNLAAVPELMIVKRRNATGNEWTVYTSDGGISKLMFLNLTDGYLTDSNLWVATPTSTLFSLPGTTPTYDVYLNTSGGTYVAYLFATLAGVSKVGSYTGTGTTQVINCGFTAGARFVLIKRTDSTGDWYVWDSARGIIAGNDPYLLLNSTAAEVTNTDYVDTYSAGFEISSTAPAAINANGGSFIFLAIA